MPVPAVKGAVKPEVVRLPDSKLVAITVVPGYWLVGCGAPG